MKKLLFTLVLSLMAFAVHAEALEWGDLDLNEQYILNQDINFDNVITFKKGDRFEVMDRMGGEIPAIYFQLHSVKCDDPTLTSEMILVNPNPKDTRDRTIALQLTEGCNIDLWVEVKDYYSASILDEYKI